MLYEYINIHIYIYKKLYIKCNEVFSTANSNDLQNFIQYFGVRYTSNFCWFCFLVGFFLFCFGFLGKSFVCTQSCQYCNRGDTRKGLQSIWKARASEEAKRLCFYSF